MKHLIIVETLTVVPGQESALQKALLDIVPDCLAEEGCLHYEIALPQNGSSEFLVFMRMKNQHALNEHEKSAHVAEFVKRFDQVLFSDFSLTIWDSI